MRLNLLFFNYKKEENVVEKLCASTSDDFQYPYSKKVIKVLRALRANNYYSSRERVQ